MRELFLYCDGSVSKSKMGYGAWLAIHPDQVHENNLTQLSTLIRIKRFENTSSTRLELQTPVWAIAELLPFAERMIIHTDSQNIVTLPQRRARLEAQGFRSRKKQLLKNCDLYRSFFEYVYG